MTEYTKDRTSRFQLKFTTEEDLVRKKLLDELALKLKHSVTSLVMSEIFEMIKEKKLET